MTYNLLKFVLFAVPMLWVSCTVVFAADVSAPVKGITTSYSNFMGVYLALQSLDGYNETVKDGNQMMIVPHFYKFTPAVLDMIAQDEATLKPIMDRLERDRQKIIMEVSKGTGKIDQGTPAASKFHETWDPFLETEITVDITLPSLSDLRLDVNEIRPSTLAAFKIPKKK